MLEVGEQIRNTVTGKTYTITWASDKVANAEVGFARAGDEEYFIKKHVRNKYPTDDAPLSAIMKEARRTKCNNDYRKNSEVYSCIRQGCGENGACVPILDYFREGAFYYTVYRKIDATSLSLSDISTLSPKEKYTLLLRIVEGLLPLHTLGVIHGDLKPDNILVQRDGDNWKIRLIDLDDCYRVGRPNEPGSILGTLDYYSPELARYNTYEVEDWDDAEEMEFVKKMAQDLTLKSDIFALGIIFCEFYGGERPQSSDDSVHSIHEAAMKGFLVMPDSVSCNPKISALIRRMLNSDYKVRPTLQQVGEDLRNIIINRLVPPEIEFEALDEEGNIFNCFITTYCDGEIHYTFDETEPIITSKKYDGPIKVTRNITVKACVIDGRKKSAVSSKMAWEKRNHSYEPKIHVLDRNVTIIRNERSPLKTQIFYTLDGTIPSKDSSLYSSTFVAPIGVTKVKAIAIEPRAIASKVVEANVYRMRVNKPEIHYKQGVVSMQSTQGCEIFYTLDGSTPTNTSLKYVKPFELKDTTKFHIKAICVDDVNSTSEINEIKRPSDKVKIKGYDNR